jgi:hypothetical protein
MNSGEELGEEIGETGIHHRYTNQVYWLTCGDPILSRGVRRRRRLLVRHVL